MVVCGADFDDLLSLQEGITVCSKPRSERSHAFDEARIAAIDTGQGFKKGDSFKKFTSFAGGESHVAK